MKNLNPTEKVTVKQFLSEGNLIAAATIAEHQDVNKLYEEHEATKDWRWPQLSEEQKERCKKYEKLAARIGVELYELSR